jgi:hypothetical protein
MLFSIGVTEDAASGRAARPGGTAVVRQTLLGLVLRLEGLGDSLGGFLLFLLHPLRLLLELRDVALAALSLSLFLISHTASLPAGSSI